MPTALFICYGGGHVKMLSPVIKELSVRGWNTPVLGLTTAYDYLSSVGLSPLGFKDFVDLKKDSYALEIGKRLREREDAGKISEKETIAYLGISYAELEEKLGATEARKAYQKSGRQAFFPIFFMERICRSISPDVVIATSSPRAEKAAIYAAKKLKIPSIALNDLFFPKNSLLWFGDKDFGDRVCVLSQLDKERLLSAGRSEEEVVVTGNPIFDILFERRENSTTKISSTKKRILWVSTPEPAYFPSYDIYSDPNLPLKIEKFLISIVSKYKNWHLTIRRHPNEPSCNLIPTPQVSISCYKDDLISDILSSDLVVTTYSTATLEAHILGKTVLCLELSPYSALFPFPDYGIAHGVSNWNEIEEKISSLVDAPKPLPLAIQKAGNATNLIAETIEELYKKNQSKEAHLN